ncbi:type I restriction enzyme HsdR N-terminal domain-containing protein [Planctomycetota bacterium]|nr:type I restriction enzyme HsdR N-terminal domain-containing protein [Planctomycetota bacterium]
MDLVDRIADISKRLNANKDLLTTEEATKNALVMPFLAALEYDVFNPQEVVPEFVADVGIKKGEKVDYAIVIDGKPMILIECKKFGTDLADCHASQLYRYFNTTKARFGVLTNGQEYQFFSDLETPNVMDKRAFLDFSISDINDHLITEIKKFCRSSFNLDVILSNASELKYKKVIKRYFAEEWVNPSEEFVRLMTGRAFSGRLTQTVLQQFNLIVKSAFSEFVSERINERLDAAKVADKQTTKSENQNEEKDTENSQVEESAIETTADELLGFNIVRAICAKHVDVNRIVMRDTQSYCGILFDDNNRKPICRLYFNTSKKQIGIIDDSKNTSKQPINSVDDIYAYSEQIIESLNRYIEISQEV